MRWVLGRRCRTLRLAAVCVVFVALSISRQGLRLVKPYSLTPLVVATSEAGLAPKSGGNEGGDALTARRQSVPI